MSGEKWRAKAKQLNFFLICYVTKHNKNLKHFEIWMEADKININRFNIWQTQVNKFE